MLICGYAIIIDQQRYHQQERAVLIVQALCTEAALNAIQRRYPQIYKSTDRFELDTSSIEVKAKDFMMSIKSAYPLRPLTASEPEDNAS